MLVGYSNNRADGCYSVYIPSTGKVVQSMHVDIHKNTLYADHIKSDDTAGQPHLRLPALSVLLGADDTANVVDGPLAELDEASDTEGNPNRDDAAAATRSNSTDTAPAAQDGASDLENTAANTDTGATAGAGATVGPVATARTTRSSGATTFVQLENNRGEIVAYPDLPADSRGVGFIAAVDDDEPQSFEEARRSPNAAA